MNQTYLLIGGNLGNRLENLRQAQELIAARVGKIQQSSSIYETAAWGMENQPFFLNQVLEVSTNVSARVLLSNILGIEQVMGRQRNEKFGPRSIDIDILFFNNDIIEEPGLHIPHPQLHLRKFTLEPLNEIASNFIHPLLEQSISNLLKECPDRLTVKKL